MLQRQTPSCARQATRSCLSQAKGQAIKWFLILFFLSSFICRLLSTKFEKIYSKIVPVKCQIQQKRESQHYSGGVRRRQIKKPVCVGSRSTRIEFRDVRTRPNTQQNTVTQPKIIVKFPRKKNGWAWKASWISPPNRPAVGAFERATCRAGPHSAWVGVYSTRLVGEAAADAMEGRNTQKFNRSKPKWKFLDFSSRAIEERHHKIGHKRQEAPGRGFGEGFRPNFPLSN